MELEELLNEIEEAQKHEKRFARHRALFNQPNLIGVSSADGIPETENSSPYSQTGFNKFQVNFRRPALDVKSLQLLSTNIPQCNSNLADTGCVFWYYRLSKYSNPTPNITNLYYVRLLPSFYKRECISTPDVYGYNQSFKNYTALATALAKSGVQDLAVNNYARLSSTAEYYENWKIPFTPNDMSLTYNASINKFQATGLLKHAFYLVWDTNVVYAPEMSVLDPSGSVVYGYVCIYTNRGLSPTGSIPVWSSGTHYYAHNIVKYNDLVYSVLNELTSTIPPPTDTTNFELVAGATDVSAFWKKTYGDVIAEWTTNTYYPAGRIVELGGVLYRSIQENRDSEPPSANWEVISDYDNWYSYLLTGYDDPNVRKAQGNTYRVEWNTNQLYQEDTTTYYNGKVWSANTQNQGCVPTPIPDYDPTRTYNVGECMYYNDDITEIFGWKIYVYVGVGIGIPNFLNTGWVIYSDTGILPTYVSSKTYDPYTFVRWDGKVYQSLQGSNTGHQPNQFPAWWKEISLYGWLYVRNAEVLGDRVPFYNAGLYGITSTFDMMEIAGTRVSFPFPFGISGQPFVENPKRILNSILGFTWNGAFNPDVLNIDAIDEETQEFQLQNYTQYQLFNRLRPIPPYYVVGSVGLELADPTSSVSLTYTADGYANLVYSSVVSIYANIVGSSSLDTQKDTNLIAITSMNCAPLGIAFWNNYVDNPLMKVNGDIYSIVLELRDEFGDPYVLTNNAVATFVFKATYEAK